jgi:hypothetical protein
VSAAVVLISHLSEDDDEDAAYCEVEEEIGVRFHVYICNVRNVQGGES